MADRREEEIPVRLVADRRDDKFIMRLTRLALKNWWKILIVSIVFGILFSSCEIPTLWGVWKKGGIDMPWSK